MKKRTSVNIENDYFFLIKHGRRNRCLEKMLEDRVNNLKSTLKILSKKLDGDKEAIIRLIRLASRSALHWEKGLPGDLSAIHKQALLALWEEAAFTGIALDEFINVLWDEPTSKKRRKREKVQ